MTDWADAAVVALLDIDSCEGVVPSMAAQALRDVQAAETRRCLSAIREVASGHPQGSPTWIELASVVRLIDSGEAL